MQQIQKKEDMELILQSKNGFSVRYAFCELILSVLNTTQDYEHVVYALTSIQIQI